MKKLVARALCAGSMLCFLVKPMFVKAEIDAVPSVAYLSHVSDVIVVGTASTSETSDAADFSVTIDVIRVVKADSHNISTAINVRGAKAVGACSYVKNGGPAGSALWFLHRTSSGELEFTVSPRRQRCNPFDNEYGIPPGVIASNWSYPPQTSAEDKLGTELAAAFDSTGGRMPYAFSINNSLLDGMSETNERASYSKLAQSGIAAVHMIGELGLLKLGDSSMLNSLADDLKGNVVLRKPTSLTRENEVIGISYRKGEETYEKPLARAVSLATDSGPASVEALRRLLNQQVSQEIRVAAATALENLHTPAAVDALSPFLWSDDVNLREAAVGAVACLANGVPVLDYGRGKNGVDLGKPSSFKTVETLSYFALGHSAISGGGAKLLEYWQSWWIQNGEAARNNKS